MNKHVLNSMLRLSAIGMTTAFAVFTLIGCSISASQIKKDIATDLTAIASQGNCEMTCELLKAYIKTRLGAPIAATNLQVGETVSRLAHNQKKEGSTPSPATRFE